MTTEVAEIKPVTTAAWKKSASHIVRLPSGVYVGIRIPDLPALIEAGQIPQNLLDAALGNMGTGVDDTPTRETIARDREFRDVLVALTVVEPKLTPEDVAGIPTEDKDMIAELALRKRDMDAEGEHIGGLTSSAKFRKFRGLDSFDSFLEGA